jgi:hypothetical protein
MHCQRLVFVFEESASTTVKTEWIDFTYAGIARAASEDCLPQYYSKFGQVLRKGFRVTWGNAHVIKLAITFLEQR